MRNSQKLTHMVAQLFELSKLEAHGIKPNFEVFSLSELVHDMVGDYQLSATQQKISLSVETKSPAIVKADIRLIERVLQNLVDNALRHTPQWRKCYGKSDRNKRTMFS